MNWYKISQENLITFLSYNSYGDLHILIKGKPYNYVEVLPNQASALQQYIKYGNLTKAFPLLRSFKQEKELYNENTVVAEDKVDSGGTQLGLGFKE